MEKETIEVTVDDIIQSTKEETFSENLRRLVNAPLTEEAHERMKDVEAVFGTPLSTIKSAMNAVLVTNALKGSEKSYELIVRMVNEAPKEEPKTLNQNLFILPTTEEQDAISNLLSDNNQKISIDEIAVPINKENE